LPVDGSSPYVFGSESGNVGSVDVINTIIINGKTGLEFCK
jgi:hypothetical protein